MSTERYVNEVGNILHSITGTDNAARVQSESKLVELLRKGAGDVLLLLAQIGAQGVGGFQLDHRLLALLLLYNCTFSRPLPGPPPSHHQHHAGPSSGTSTPGALTSDGSGAAAGVPSDPFVQLGETAKTRIELVLCSGMTDEQDPRLRKGIGECAGRWASGCWRYKRPCPHFPPILLQLTTSPLPFFRITPFQVLVIHPTLLSTSVADPVAPESLAQMITAGLHDPSTDVKVEAIRAMTVLLDKGMSAQARDSLGPALVNSVFECLTSLPPNLLFHGFVPLTDLAWNHSALFVPCLSQVLPALVALLFPPANLPDYHWSKHQPLQVSYADWRENAVAAIELLLVFYEWQYKAIAADEALRKVEENLTECLLAFECAEAEESASKDADEEEEGLDDALVSLGRLTDATDGSRVWNEVLHHARSLVHHGDWRCRYAAYMGLYTILPSYRELARDKVEELLRLLETGAKDPSTAVRTSFLRVIGELYISKAIREQFSDGVLEVISGLLDDPDLGVRLRAVATLQDFYASEPSKKLPEKAAGLVPRLLELYAKDDVAIKRKVLHALPLAAWRAPAAFKPYAPVAFKLFLSAASDPATSGDLRVSALGAITRISTLAGKELFAPVAAQFAELLINVSQNNTKLQAGDPQVLLRTWIGFCEAIGVGFVSFLPIFVPQLLAACSDLDGTPKPTESVLWFYHQIEPIDVLSAISILVAILGQAMKPYLAPCFDLAIKTVRSGHAGEADRALVVIPSLLHLAKETHAWGGGPEGLADILMVILGYTNLQLEYMSQTGDGYDSFANSIGIIGTMPPVEIVQAALQSATRHVGIIKGLREIRAGEYAEYDEEEKQYAVEEQEEEMFCLRGIRKTVGYLKELNQGASAGQDVDEKKRTFALAVEGVVQQIEGELALVESMALKSRV